jgi:hypothetical protein
MFASALTCWWCGSPPQVYVPAPFVATHFKDPTFPLPIVIQVCGVCVPGVTYCVAYVPELTRRGVCIPVLTGNIVCVPELTGTFRVRLS